MYADWETDVNARLEILLTQELAQENYTAEFYEALGDTFLQLHKEADAIWSYEKARSVNPWRGEVKIKLSALQEKLFLPMDLSTTFPLPYVYMAFSLVFVFFLLFIKYRLRNFFGALSVISLLVIVYLVWADPLKGIIVRSTFLYPTPSESINPLINIPLASGVKVEVIGEEQQGQWIKIKDNDGNIGFIFNLKIRII